MKQDPARRSQPSSKWIMIAVQIWPWILYPSSFAGIPTVCTSFVPFWSFLCAATIKKTEATVQDVVDDVIPKSFRFPNLCMSIHLLSISSGCCYKGTVHIPAIAPGSRIRLWTPQHSGPRKHGRQWVVLAWASDGAIRVMPVSLNYHMGDIGIKYSLWPQGIIGRIFRAVCDVKVGIATKIALSGHPRTLPSGYLTVRHGKSL